jgi:predicted metal-binding protein
MQNDIHPSFYQKWHTYVFLSTSNSLVTREGDERCIDNQNRETELRILLKKKYKLHSDARQREELSIQKIHCQGSSEERKDSLSAYHYRS